MYALLKACNKHFYQVSRQIKFKIKALFPLMSARNATAFVQDCDVIMFRGHSWWVLISGFNVAAVEEGEKNVNSIRLPRKL